MVTAIKYATGTDVGNEICALIGVDPKTVKEINIRIAPDELVEVNVVTIVLGDGKPITQMLRQYVLQGM